jgi:hypothetical protein
MNIGLSPESLTLLQFVRTASPAMVKALSVHHFYHEVWPKWLDQVEVLEVNDQERQVNFTLKDGTIFSLLQLYVNGRVPLPDARLVKGNALGEENEFELVSLYVAALGEAVYDIQPA